MIKSEKLEEIRKRTRRGKLYRLKIARKQRMYWLLNEKGISMEDMYKYGYKFENVL